MFALLGFVTILFMVNCNTAIQMASPPEYLGRIMGLYTFVFLGSAPFGSLLDIVGLFEIILILLTAKTYSKQK